VTVGLGITEDVFSFLIGVEFLFGSSDGSEGALIMPRGGGFPMYEGIRSMDLPQRDGVQDCLGGRLSCVVFVVSDWII
jgi:hypothetical protein